VVIGVVSAVNQYRWLDHVLTTTSFVLVSVPGFFLGLLLIYIFALRLPWLPTGGLNTPGVPSTVRDSALHLLMPATVLGASLTAGLARYTRAAMLETLSHDYIVAARAKGLTWGKVLVRHALRNALLPIITITGLRIPLLLGGSVVVEEVFNWPGLGQLGVLAVFSQDYPTIMALNLLIAVTVVLSNLATDATYALVDPRIRYD
jgi:peptide/nickel transport system permease protein